MELRTARMLGMSGLLLVCAMGCGKFSRDHSKVIASVGGEKITEKSFGETVRMVVGDDAKASEILTNEAARDQRNQFLDQMVTQKALLRFAKNEGLNKDPKVKLAMEVAMANVYYQALIEKRVGKAEPTEAQIKALYDEFLKQSQAAGQAATVPPFDQVKAQLPAMWKRKQGEQASVSLLIQLKKNVVFAPEYRPAQMPQMPQ